MNDPYSSARKLLTQMPEEIFELWFDGRIETNGWPPNGAAWTGALRGKTIKYWTKLQWKKYPIEINKNSLTESSKKIIDGLLEGNFGNEINAYSLAPNLNSTKKIENIIRYVKENSKLPNPLIFLYEDGKYEIVDGSHRLCVFFPLQKFNLDEIRLESMQEAWIGKIK